jgi:hypothetical protein
MSDDDLIKLGFARVEDGTLFPPHAAGWAVRFIPCGKYYDVRIALGDGNEITVVVDKSAIKITRVGAKL